MRVATEFHDCDLFFNFVLLAAEVVGDGQVGPRAWDALPFELVETVGARIVARHDLDGLRSERAAYINISGNGESLGIRREFKGDMMGAWHGIGNEGRGRGGRGGIRDAMYARLRGYSA
jgi:hypothetical protein